MNKKVVILGAGRVGASIAIEMSKQYNVTVADIDEASLSKLKRCFAINCVQTDVTVKKKLETLVAEADLVIGAVPGALGYDVVKKVIETGKNMVDISFMPEDAFELDERAKYKNVSVVIDCGIAPGISNMILGYHYSNMKVNKYECVVGGLPFEREWPWQYKAVFSPVDVIEEYVRPARFVENGMQITREALSDPELIYFKDIGTLEAWNSDGLRTLLKTMDVPNMIEKTLRYPGTIEYLKVLRESGFFSNEEITVNGIKIKPIDVTTKILQPSWELKKGKEDFTVMRAKVLGKSGAENVGYEYFIYDKYDSKSGLHSMSRTTGFACTAVAEILLEGLFTKHGIITPEAIAGTDGLFTQIMNYMEDRGVEITISRLY